MTPKQPDYIRNRELSKALLSQNTVKISSKFSNHTRFPCVPKKHQLTFLSSNEPIPDSFGSSSPARNTVKPLGLSRRFKNEKKQKSLVSVIDLTKRKKPKEIGLKTRRNWELLYRSQVLALRLSKVYKKILKDCMKTVVDAQVKGLGTLSHMLKEYIVESDQEFIKKVIKMVSILPENRTRDQIELIERLLSVRMSDFAIFPFREKVIFSKIMSLQKFPKSTLLVMNGNYATCIFFVLSGQVEIFTLNDGCKYRMSLLNPGNCYGADSLQVDDFKRENCAATVVDTILLVIDKRDFQLELFNQYDTINLKEKALQSLGTLPIFINHRDFLDKIMCLFKFQTYTKNDLIQDENSIPKQLFWIIEGTCKALKTLTKNGAVKVKGKKPEILTKKDTVQLEIQELVQGDSFPNIPLIEPSQYDRMKYLGPNSVPKNRYIELFAKLKTESSSTVKADITIVAATKVVVASMQFVEFIPIVPNEILYELLTKPSIVKYSVRELQDQLSSNRQWNLHKKTVIDRELLILIYKDTTVK